MSGDKLVSIIVVPRERFGRSIESLDSLLESTPIPHDLLYMATAVPRPILTEIHTRAKTHGFRVIEDPELKLPLFSRNRGARLATTKYIVFVDNDLMVRPGWIEPLIRC